jgi:hypothetical protein
VNTFRSLGSFAWATAGLFFAGMSGSLVSQVTAPIDTQIERARRLDSNPLLAPQISDLRPEEEMNLVAPATPGDDDLGQQLILKRSDQYKAFRVFGDFATLWSNNVTLLKDSPLSDGYVIGTVGGQWQPIITPNLIGNITVAQQFFRYMEFSDLDFDSFNAGGNLSYVFQELDGLSPSLGYNYNRLTDDGFGDSFFQVHTISVGVQKPWVVSSAQLVYVGGIAEFDFADPTAPQRNDYRIYAGYQVDLTRSIRAQLFYQIAVYDYTDISRTDLNNTISASGTYKFTEWLSLTAVASGGFNNSSRPVFDYEAFNGGGNVTIDFKF